jgi:hypothetical protein
MQVVTVVVDKYILQVKKVTLILLVLYKQVKFQKLQQQKKMNLM